MLKTVRQKKIIVKEKAIPLATKSTQYSGTKVGYSLDYCLYWS